MLLPELSLPAAATARPLGLQSARLVAYGVALWFAAALMIRYGTPAGFFGPVTNLPVYVATCAGAFGLVWSLRGMPHLLRGLVIVNLSALLCDGFAIAWLPGLYGTSAATSLPGIAWLSFAVGAVLLSAVAMERA